MSCWLITMRGESQIQPHRVRWNRQPQLHGRRSTRETANARSSEEKRTRELPGDSGHLAELNLGFGVLLRLGAHTGAGRRQTPGEELLIEDTSSRLNLRSGPSGRSSSTRGSGDCLAVPEAVLEHGLGEPQLAGLLPLAHAHAPRAEHKQSSRTSRGTRRTRPEPPGGAAVPSQSQEVQAAAQQPAGAAGGGPQPLILGVSGGPRLLAGLAREAAKKTPARGRRRFRIRSAHGTCLLFVCREKQDPTPR